MQLCKKFVTINLKTNMISAKVGLGHVFNGKKTLDKAPEFLEQDIKTSGRRFCLLSTICCLGVFP